jgi:hypothetical protein
MTFGTSINMNSKSLVLVICIVLGNFTGVLSQNEINFSPVHRQIFTNTTRFQISEQFFLPRVQKVKQNLRSEQTPLNALSLARFSWYSDASCTTAVEETSFHTGQCAPWAGPYVIVNVTAQTSTSWTTQFNYFKNADCSTVSSFAPATVSFTKDDCVTIPGSLNGYFKFDATSLEQKRQLTSLPASVASSSATNGAITQAVYSSQQDCLNVSSSDAPEASRSVMTVNYPFGSCFPGWKGFDFKPVSCEIESHTVLAYDSHDGSCTGIGLTVMAPTEASFTCVPSTNMPGFWVRYHCSSSVSP